MATTITSTALDFDNIKNNLKTFLANKEQFKDYNFEAAGINNILDVLAYNTHVNGLMANFALNESFLPTAQLRSSLVSLAEGIGYVPDTDTASQATVRLTFNSSASGRATKYTLPAFTRFTSSVDDVTYNFSTVENYIATDDGTGFYEFKKTDGSNQLPIKEGTFRTKTFLVGEFEDNPVYIIPDTSLDASTVSVKVFLSASSTRSTTYGNILNATTINANSTIYILKESPNGFFELSFGDGSTFGIAPQAGNRIEVEYLATKGEPANGATLFTPSGQFSPDSIVTADLQVTTISNSTGGKEKESIESIRKNAPFQYATQNRAVTADDYSSLILKNYSTLIKDIASFGGQDAVKKEFGAVYTSILFEDSVTAETITNTKNAILDLFKQLSIVSFNVRFLDPVQTFIEVDSFFQFNPKLTSESVNTIKSTVTDTIQQYFTDNTGKFKQAFRRSNMLTKIDESNAAILSSRANVRMQQRFTPTAPAILTKIKQLANVTLSNEQSNKISTLVNDKNFIAAANYYINNSLSNNTFSFLVDQLSAAANNTGTVLQFPVSIAAPDDDTFIISSNEFTFKTQTCVIQNKLSSNILQIVTAAGGNFVEDGDNIGSYDAIAGTVNVGFFTPSSIGGGESQIKLAAVPANQSAIVPERNELILFDASASNVTTVLTEATN